MARTKGTVGKKPVKVNGVPVIPAKAFVEACKNTTERQREMYLRITYDKVMVSSLVDTLKKDLNEYNEKSLVINNKVMKSVDTALVLYELVKELESYWVNQMVELHGTPHFSWFSKEQGEELSKEVIENVDNFFVVGGPGKRFHNYKGQYSFFIPDYTPEKYSDISLISLVSTVPMRVFNGSREVPFLSGKIIISTERTLEEMFGNDPYLYNFLIENSTRLLERKGPYRVPMEEVMVVDDTRKSQEKGYERSDDDTTSWSEVEVNNVRESTSPTS